MTILEVLKDARRPGQKTDGSRGKAPDLERNRKARADPDQLQLEVPKLDLQWYTGVSVIIIQLIVAAVVGAVYKEWVTIIVTIVGTALCLVVNILLSF